jgi:hypothetical protein
MKREYGCPEVHWFDFEIRTFSSLRRSSLLCRTCLVVPQPSQRLSELSREFSQSGCPLRAELPASPVTCAPLLLRMLHHRFSSSWDGWIYFLHELVDVLSPSLGPLRRNSHLIQTCLTPSRHLGVFLRLPGSFCRGNRCSSLSNFFCWPCSSPCKAHLSLSARLAVEGSQVQPLPPIWSPLLLRQLGTVVPLPLLLHYSGCSLLTFSCSGSL